MEWEKIHTSLDAIINKISKEKQRMFWVLMGRALLQSPNDNWNIELFLLGHKKPRDAIIHYIKTYLSLTKEKEFTILKRGIFSKQLILKQDFPLYIMENHEDDTIFPLEIHDFYNMICNEIINIPIKHNPPLLVKWKKRGIFSSEKYHIKFLLINRRMGSIVFTDTLDFNEKDVIPLLRKYVIPDIKSIIYNYYKVYDIHEKTIASESNNFYLKATSAYLEVSKISGNMNFHDLFN